MNLPDVDIDFADREQVLKLIPHVAAMQRMPTGSQHKHKTGVYFHDVPANPFTSWCDIDYQQAEQLGFFKVDLLNVGLYQSVNSKQHLDQLAAREPMWDLLLQEDFSNLLFHLNGHSEVLRRTAPRSIEQLAAVLAMIRPAKRYLIGRPWPAVMNQVWVKPTDDSYYFKHSHAISYSLLVVVHMNLICEQMTAVS